MIRFDKLQFRVRFAPQNCPSAYAICTYRLELIPDPEEGGYTAFFPDLPGCITCGETPEETVCNALDAKRVWLEAALEDDPVIAGPSSANYKSEYSGQFKLRIPKSLHRTLVIQAKAEGISLNQYCLYLLTKNISL